MDEIVGPVLRQLATQSPVLIACLVGIILAFVFWGRSPAASVFVLIAALVFLFLSVVWPIGFQVVFRASQKAEWRSNTLNVIFTVMGVAYSVIHAAALGLLLTAAFVGRRRA